MGMTVKQAQAMVDELSKHWKVPSLKVAELEPEFMNILYLTCYFDPTNWIFTIKNDTTEEDIRHEFHHYMVAFLIRSRGLEEEMSNKFAKN